MKHAARLSLPIIPLVFAFSELSNPAVAAPKAAPAPPAVNAASVQLKSSKKPGADGVHIPKKSGTKRFLKGVITGSYNNQPRDGLTLRGNTYVIDDPAQFNNNGKVDFGSGIYAENAKITLNGGTFTGNPFSALDASKWLQTGHQ